MKTPNQNICFSYLIFFILLLPFAASAQEKKQEKILLNFFERIVQRGGGNLVLSYAPEQSIRISGAKEAVSQVAFYTVDNTLFISSKGGDLDWKNVKISIASPTVPKIEMRGGGTFIVEEGFMPVQLFKCSIEAGGELDASALQAASVYACIQDGGSMKVNAETYLKGEVRGGGQILYQGNPQVQKMIAGGGRIYKE